MDEVSSLRWCDIVDNALQSAMPAPLNWPDESASFEEILRSDLPRAPFPDEVSLRIAVLAHLLLLPRADLSSYLSKIAPRFLTRDGADSSLSLAKRWFRFPSKFIRNCQFTTFHDMRSDENAVEACADDLRPRGWLYVLHLLCSRLQTDPMDVSIALITALIVCLRWLLFLRLSTERAPTDLSHQILESHSLFASAMSFLYSLPSSTSSVRQQLLQRVWVEWLPLLPLHHASAATILEPSKSRPHVPPQTVMVSVDDLFDDMSDDDSSRLDLRAPARRPQPSSSRSNPAGAVSQPRKRGRLAPGGDEFSKQYSSSVGSTPSSIRSPPTKKRSLNANESNPSSSAASPWLSLMRSSNLSLIIENLSLISPADIAPPLSAAFFAALFKYAPPERLGDLMNLTQLWWPAHRSHAAQLPSRVCFAGVRRALESHSNEDLASLSGFFVRICLQQAQQDAKQALLQLCRSSLMRRARSCPMSVLVPFGELALDVLRRQPPAGALPLELERFCLRLVITVSPPGTKPPTLESSLSWLNLSSTLCPLPLVCQFAGDSLAAVRADVPLAEPTLPVEEEPFEPELGADAAVLENVNSTEASESGDEIPAGFSEPAAAVDNWDEFDDLDDFITWTT